MIQISALGSNAIRALAPVRRSRPRPYGAGRYSAALRAGGAFGARTDRPQNGPRTPLQLDMPSPRTLRARVVTAVVPAAGFFAANRALHDQAGCLHQVLLLGRAGRQASFDVRELR